MSAAPDLKITTHQDPDNIPLGLVTVKPAGTSASVHRARDSTQSAKLMEAIKAEKKRKSYLPPGYVAIKPKEKSPTSPDKSPSKGPISKRQSGIVFVSKKSLGSSHSGKSSRSTKSSKSSHSHNTLIDVEAGPGGDHKSRFTAPDDPSYFIDAETLATYRGICALLAGGLVVWCFLTQHLLYFASLANWQWLGMVLYFTVWLRVG